MSEERYSVRVHDEGGSGYRLWADVEELPGLFASGRDHDELLEALAETIGGYLSEQGHEVQIENATEVSRSEDGSRVELSVQVIDPEQEDVGRPRFDDPELDELARKLWARRFEKGRRVMDDDFIRGAIALAAQIRARVKKNQREAG